jgi:hypothetical protein
MAPKGESLLDRSARGSLEGFSGSMVQAAFLQVSLVKWFSQVCKITKAAYFLSDDAP